MDKSKVMLVFGFVFFLFLTNPVNANSTYLKRELPYLEDSTMITADLHDSGVEQLLVGRDGAVYIYDQDLLVSEITDFGGKVTALAVGDLTGDFRPEILIGTDRMNFLVYQWQNNQWLQINEFRHLWAPIIDLRVADYTGNGWGDVTVLNQRGEAFVYLSWQGSLDLFWRSQPNQTIKYIKAADLTGDGNDELVFAHTSGYIGVLSWVEEHFELISENYPWGSIENLMIADRGAGALPEIIVTTGQNFIYSWQWDGNNLGLRSYFSHEMRGQRTIYDNGGLINIDPTMGLTSYTLQTSRLNEQWRMPFYGITNLIRFNDQFIIKDQNKRFYLLEPFDYNSLALFLNDMLLDSPPSIIVNEARFYIELADFASLVGWTLLEDGSLMINDNHVNIDVEAGIVFGTDLVMPIIDAVLLDNSKIYLAVEALKTLGYHTEFDLDNNSLHINKLWGWW